MEYWHPELATTWGDLGKRPKIEFHQEIQPEGLSLTMLPFQLEGLSWLKQQEQTEFHGGILADEMGMGKTIQTISLLMSEPRGKPNLVVAPTVALIQWANEIQKFTGAGLTVALFHGAKRSAFDESLKDFDVILTTCKFLMNRL